MKFIFRSTCRCGSGSWSSGLHSVLKDSYGPSPQWSLQQSLCWSNADAQSNCWSFESLEELNKEDS